MDIVELKNVKHIEVQPIGESIDVAWRSIVVTTETGKVEIVLTSKDIDQLKVCL